MIRKESRPSMAALATLGLLIQGAGCDGNVIESNAPRTAQEQGQQKSKTYDGETIFQGIFFGVGPVAEILPELFQCSGVEKSKELHAHLTQSRAFCQEFPTIEQRREAATQAMRDADPTFFQHFGSSLQSGDHGRTEDAMKEGARLLLKAVGDDIDRSTQPVTADGNYLWTDNYVAAVNAAVAANVVAVALVGVAVVAAVAVAASPVASHQGLQRDMVIDYLATHLKV